MEFERSVRAHNDVLCVRLDDSTRSVNLVCEQRYVNFELSPEAAKCLGRALLFAAEEVRLTYGD